MEEALGGGREERWNAQIGWDCGKTSALVFMQKTAVALQAVDAKRAGHKSRPDASQLLSS